MKLHIQTGGFALIPLMVVVALFVGVGAGVAITNISTNNGDIESAPQIANTESEVSEEVVIESEFVAGMDANLETEVETSVEASVHVAAPAVVSPKILEQIPITTGFAIQNISATVGEEDVSISWNTTIASDSRLVLYNGDTEKIFVSKNESSTEHSVYIDALASSKEYSYEIIATAGDKEVRKFSSVQTERVYTFRKAPYVSTSLSEGECMIFVLEDTQGKPLKDTQVTVSGYTTSSAIGAKTYTTDEDGEIKLCRNATELKVVVPSIGYTFKSTGLIEWTVTRERR